MTENNTHHDTKVAQKPSPFGCMQGLSTTLIDDIALLEPILSPDDWLLDEIIEKTTE